MGESLHKAKIEVDASQAKRETEELAQEVSTLSQETRKMGDDGQQAFDGVANSIHRIELTSIIQQVQMVGNALGDLARPAVTFEQSMADLEAITGYAGKELEDLTTTARRVGVESGLGAAESARAFSVLAGQIDVPLEALKELQQQTITLAQAGALPLEEAANAVAGTINQFAMEADQAGRIVNVLAAGSRAGGAEVTDLAESFKAAGAAANAAGVSLEETAGAIEVLAQNNTKGAEAGTALRNILIAMQTRLNIDVGKTGFVGGLKIIQQELDGMSSDIERTTFLARNFGRENIVAAQYLLQNADAVNEMTVAVTDTNAALEQADLRNDTWAHKIELAKAKIDDMMVSMTGLTGSLLPMAGIIGEQIARFSGLIPIVSTAIQALKGLQLQTIATTVAQHGWNAALAANPIGAIITAITALVAAVVYAYSHFNGFKQSVDRLWAKLKELWSMLYERLKPAFDLIAKVVGWQLKAVMSFFVFQLEAVATFLGWVAQGVIYLINCLDKLIAPLRKAINGLKELLGLQGTVSSKAAAGGGSQTIATQHGATGSWGEAAQGSSVIGDITPPVETADSASTFSEKPERQKVYNLITIEGLQNNISKLQEQMKSATIDEAIELQNLINKYQEILDKLQLYIKMGSTPIEAVKSSQRDINEQLFSVVAPGVSKEERQYYTSGNKGRDLISSIAKSAPQALYEATKKSLDNAKRQWQAYVSSLQDTMGSISGIMGSMGDIIGGSAGQWLDWAANVVQAISQALPKLIALFTANTAVAASEGGKAVAGVPIAGPAMAVAAIASILGALAAIPKPTAFANGGIVSGPTYALVGEYAGARNNPEVIAPLDKLRHYLREDARSSGGGEVSFRIEGRTLVGILNKEAKHNKLS